VLVAWVEELVLLGIHFLDTASQGTDLYYCLVAWSLQDHARNHSETRGFRYGSVVGPTRTDHLGRVFFFVSCNTSLVFDPMMCIVPIHIMERTTVMCCSSALVVNAVPSRNSH